MRTVVVSDLHLGSLLERDVLRRPKAVEALVAEVEKSDRLVLLGDTIELLEGRPRQAMLVAEPVLRRLGRALGHEGQAVLLPGNHDHTLIRAWLGRQLRSGAPLSLDSIVPRAASTILSELTSWLEPAQVEVRYPGVWLGADIFATHGHYCDRHLLDPTRRRDRHPGSLTVADYERAPGTDAGATAQALEARFPEIGAFVGAERAVDQFRRGVLGALGAVAEVPGARLIADGASLVMEQGLHRRAAIPGMAKVASLLEIDSRFLVFGHIHRRGPLPGDDVDMWRPDTNGPRLLNSGSWVYDSALVGLPTGRPRSYRPGGAVVIEEGAPPACIDVLADVSDDDLRGKV